MTNLEKLIARRKHLLKLIDFYNEKLADNPGLFLLTYTIAISECESMVDIIDYLIEKN